MHRSQAICSACRRQLAVVSSPSSNPPFSQLYQWQGRSSSNSASADYEKNKPSLAYDFVPASDEQDPNHSRPKKWNGRPSSATGSGPYYDKPQGRANRRHNPHLPNSMDVFQEVVKQRANQDGSVGRHRDNSPDQIEFYKKLEQMKPMMAEESLHRCFQFFLNEVWSKEEYRSSDLLKIRATELLRRVAMEKAKDMYSDKWPSMAQITDMIHKIGSSHMVKVAEMVLTLVESILACTSLQIDAAKKQQLLEDLVETWIVFSRHGLNPDTSSLSTSQEAQFRLPEINGTKLDGYVTRNDSLGALGLVFGHTVSSQNREFQAAILATFVLLVDPAHSNVSIRLKARPFLASVGRVLAAVRTSKNTLANVFKSRPQILWYVIKSWKSTVAHLSHWIPSSASATSKIEDRIIEGKFGKDVTMDPSHFQQRLSSALLMGSAASVEAVWTEYWGESDVPDEERATGMRRHPALFNAFIGAFTAIRRPQRALDVWDAMAGIGINATLDTWAAMLEGFKKAKDPAGLEGVWKKLVASGAQLNGRVWRARISGLMESREPQAGLRALKELAEQSERPGGVPFTIDVVNAAVAGLIRLNAMPAAQEVLQWASNYEVSPDIFTYNILLRSLVRGGSAAQIESLLQLMRTEGIEPDAATFTTLLDGLVVASRDKSPEQRLTMFRTFIDDMEQAGAVANIDTLGRMIHLLIRDGQQTLHHTQGVVGAILRYAKTRNLRLSRHIYTLLVDYYFSQTPPAIEKVIELIMDPKALVLNATGGLDRVFWERVIGGFSSAGEVDRAFDLFRQIHDLGTALTLDCLETLLRCLVGRGQMTEARELVAMVAQERGASENSRERGPRGRFWRHGFWGFASDYNLFTMPKPEK